MTGTSRVRRLGSTRVWTEPSDCLDVFMTLDGRTADRCTPACGYRSVRLDWVPLQDS